MRAKTAFCMTYGDGVSDVDITASIAFHTSHGKLVTVTAVQPPARFGGLGIEGTSVFQFQEKPKGEGGWINGGFFVLSPAVICGDYRRSGCLRSSPCKRLTAKRQVEAFFHRGFWQPMDTIRDKHGWRTMGRGERAMENMVNSWQGRRVFVTGHTGFKGGWLALWLAQPGRNGARLCPRARYQA